MYVMKLDAYRDNEDSICRKPCLVCNSILTTSKGLFCSRACWQKNYYSQKKKPSVLALPKERYLTHRLASLKRHIESCGKESCLSREDLGFLIEHSCFYCGAPGGQSLVLRIDPSLGFNTNNVVPACKRCAKVRAAGIPHEKMAEVAEVCGWTVTGV